MPLIRPVLSGEEGRKGSICREGEDGGGLSICHSLPDSKTIIASHVETSPRRRSTNMSKLLEVQEWRYLTSLQSYKTCRVLPRGAEYFAETVAFRPRVQVDSYCLRWLYVICIDDLYFDGGKTRQSEGEGVRFIIGTNIRPEFPAALTETEREADFSSVRPPPPPPRSITDPRARCAAFSDRLSIRQT